MEKSRELQCKLVDYSCDTEGYAVTFESEHFKVGVRGRYPMSQPNALERLMDLMESNEITITFSKPKS